MYWPDNLLSHSLLYTLIMYIWAFIGTKDVITITIALQLHTKITIGKKGDTMPPPSVPVHIVATVRIQPPFSYACIFHDKSCNPAGINTDIFRAVMLFLGIEYTLVPAEDDTTGYILPNGTWRGMIGQLMRGEANMTASLIGVESERLNVIDYSAPVSYYDNGFIVQKSSISAMKDGLPSFLISPLSSPIWYSLIGSLICMVVLVCATNYILQKQSRAKSIEDAWFGVSRGLLRQTQIDPSSLTGIQILMMA